MATFTDNFISTLGQTTFDTSKEFIPSTASIFKNGSRLVNSVDVDVSSGNRLVLSTAAAEADKIVITATSAEGYIPQVNQGTFFDRLGFNFDTKKFGKALTVGNQAELYYSSNPIKLKKWQKDLLMNGRFQNFFKNPISQDVEVLKNDLVTIRNALVYIVNANTPWGANTSTDIPEGKANLSFLLSALSTTNTTISSLNGFKSHTDRLSGVTKSQTDDPDYESAIRVGTNISQLVNAIDGVKDFSPILGSFTSLFVKDDIVTYSVNLKNLKNESGYSLAPSQWANANNFFVSNTGDTIGVLLFTSNDANAFSNTLNTISSFVNTRKNHDKNYYLKCFDILNDYNKVNQLTSIPSPPAIVLIRDLIGTEELKKLL